MKKVYEVPSAKGQGANQVYKGQIPYGLHIPFNQGYDAWSRRNAKRAEDHDSSGNFYSPSLDAQIELWITDLSAEFSLSGQVGQSRMLREFFPHSFNDVTLRITGNVASTQEYNRLAAFVRQSHWQALQNINRGVSTDQTIAFTLYDRTPDAFRDPKRGVKGNHRPWTVGGYVQSIAAGAVRHEVAPEFTVNFIVTTSQLTGSTGLWTDTADNGGSTLKTFLQLLNIANGGQRTQSAGFVQDPISPAVTSKTHTSPSLSTGVEAYVNWSARAASAILSALG